MRITSEPAPVGRSPRILSITVGLWAVAGLIATGCQDASEVTSPTETAAPVAVALEETSVAGTVDDPLGSGFYNIVDEQGNIIWQGLEAAPFTEASFRMETAPAGDEFIECKLVTLDTVEVVQCIGDGTPSTTFTGTRGCPDQLYPYGANQDERNCYLQGFAYNRPVQGQQYRVTAAPTAPGGLVMLRWEVTLGGVPTDCSEPEGDLTCTVQIPETGAAPYFVLVYGEPPFQFGGFLPPLAHDPAVVNVRRAGSAVPLEFSLGGDYGLDILAEDSPSSMVVACPEGAQESGVPEAAETSGKSTLSYDEDSDTYTYVWKTERAWDGTCRELNLELSDGSAHTAQLRFGK